MVKLFSHGKFQLKSHRGRLRFELLRSKLRWEQKSLRHYRQAKRVRVNLR